MLKSLLFIMIALTYAPGHTAKLTALRRCARSDDRNEGDAAAGCEGQKGEEGKGQAHFALLFLLARMRRSVALKCGEIGAAGRGQGTKRAGGAVAARPLRRAEGPESPSVHVGSVRAQFRPSSALQRFDANVTIGLGPDRQGGGMRACGGGEIRDLVIERDGADGF